MKLCGEKGKAGTHRPWGVAWHGRGCRQWQLPHNSRLAREALGLQKAGGQVLVRVTFGFVVYLCDAHTLSHTCLLVGYIAAHTNAYINRYNGFYMLYDTVYDFHIPECSFPWMDFGSLIPNF